MMKTIFGLLFSLMPSRAFLEMCMAAMDGAEAFDHDDVAAYIRLRRTVQVLDGAKVRALESTRRSAKAAREILGAIVDKQTILPGQMGEAHDAGMRLLRESGAIDELGRVIDPWRSVDLLERAVRDYEIAISLGIGVCSK